MTGLSYPAARVVAERLEERIAVSKTAYKDGTGAPKPDARSIEEIITTAFWASLLREEGHSPRISIAFVPPEQSIRPLKFSPPVRLDATQLSRIAPAVEKPGIHIGVWSYEGDLYAWGVTRTVPMWCFILEVIRPGLLVVKFRRDDPSVKFANVAVLDGAVVKFIEQEPAAMSECVTDLDVCLRITPRRNRYLRYWNRHVFSIAARPVWQVMSRRQPW